MSDNIAPRGKQKGRALEWAFVRAQTGTAYINVKCETDSGHIVYWRGFFTERTLDRTLESLRYFGWTGDDIENLARDGMGQLEAQLDIGHEEYEGKTRAVVNWVNNGSGVASMKGAMDAGELSAFAAEMNAKIRGAQAAAKQQAGQGRGGGFPVADHEDDLPF